MNTPGLLAARLTDPIAPDIREGAFFSDYDGSRQTYLLKDFRAGSKRTPLLVVYLHGAVSHQDQGMTAGIYQNAFGRLADELARRSAVYICPEYRGGSWMGPAAEADLAQLLRSLVCDYRPEKVVVTGGSMGGTSALIYSMRHADEVDGVIALCPATEAAAMFEQFPQQFLASYGGSPLEVPDTYQERSARCHCSALVRMPVFLSHGTDDAVIPVAHSRVLAENLRQLGGAAHYCEIAGGNHDAPLAVDWKESLRFVLSGGSD